MAAIGQNRRDAADWRALHAELTVWDTLISAKTDSSAVPPPLTLWWRDDDAVTRTRALERMLGISEHAGVTLGLAVIPNTVEGALVECVMDAERVDVLQHGFSHDNYAGHGEKKQELGTHRCATEVVNQLQLGLSRLREMFGERFTPVLVPPWNRVAPELLPRLTQIGFKGVSTFSARTGRFAAPGLKQTNCHVDLIDWRGTRGFRGTHDVLADLINVLRDRRLQVVDASEPTGIMTHHLVHDEACWEFMEKLFECTNDHACSHWLSARDAVLVV